LVRLRVEQCVDGLRGGGLELHQPAGAVRVGVDELGCALQGRVHRDDLAGDRRVDLGDALGRLDLAQRVAGLERGADLGQLDEDDVAQGVLREVRDADLEAARLGRGEPFVFGGVPQILGNQVESFYGRSGSQAGLAYFRSPAVCNAVTCTGSASRTETV